MNHVRKFGRKLQLSTTAQSRVLLLFALTLSLINLTHCAHKISPPLAKK